MATREAQLKHLEGNINCYLCMIGCWECYAIPCYCSIVGCTWNAMNEYYMSYLYSHIWKDLIELERQHLLESTESFLWTSMKKGGKMSRPYLGGVQSIGLGHVLRAKYIARNMKGDYESVIDDLLHSLKNLKGRYSLCTVGTCICFPCLPVSFPCLGMCEFNIQHKFRAIWYTMDGLATRGLMEEEEKTLWLELKVKEIEKNSVLGWGRAEDMEWTMAQMEVILTTMKTYWAQVLNDKLEMITTRYGSRTAAKVNQQQTLLLGSVGAQQLQQQQDVGEGEGEGTTSASSVTGTGTGNSNNHHVEFVSPPITNPNPIEAEAPNASIQVLAPEVLVAEYAPIPGSTTTSTSTSSTGATVTATTAVVAIPATSASSSPSLPLPPSTSGSHSSSSSSSSTSSNMKLPVSALSASSTTGPSHPNGAGVGVGALSMASSEVSCAERQKMTAASAPPINNTIDLALWTRNNGQETGKDVT